jgi:hypothetical protein
VAPEPVAPPSAPEASVVTEPVAPVGGEPPTAPEPPEPPLPPEATEPPVPSRPAEAAEPPASPIAAALPVVPPSPVVAEPPAPPVTAAEPPAVDVVQVPAETTAESASTDSASTVIDEPAAEGSEAPRNADERSDPA